MATTARIFEWTEDEVIEAGNELRLLMLHTDDDVYLFPVLQFRNGKIFARLDEVLHVFQSVVDDPWTWAHWMTPALPEDRSLETRKRISDVKLEVALHGSSHNWWWVPQAETTDVQDRLRK